MTKVTAAAELSVLEEALRFAQVGLYRYRFDGTILAINDAAFETLGLRGHFAGPSEVIGRSIESLIQYVGPRGRVRQLIREHGEARNILYPFRTLDGEIRWTIHDSFQAADPATGETVVQAIIKDVTASHGVEEERERLLAENSRQRRLLEAILDADPTGIAVVAGPELRFQAANPAYRSFTSHPEIDPVGRAYRDVWSTAKNGEGIPSLLERALASGVAADETDVPQPIAGTTRHFSLHVRRVLWEHEAAALLVVWDTTEQVLAIRRVAELAEEAQRRAGQLQTVLENMLDGVLVCDVNGRATLTNQAGLRISGLDSTEELLRVLNESPEQFAFRKADGEPISRDAMGLTRALGGETVVEEEYLVYNRRLGRDLHVRESAAPLRDARGRISGAVSVIRDVTAFAELDQLKDQFISVAAHELKTPVAVMKGYAQSLLRTGGDLSAPRRRMLEAINRGADRIDNTVRELLDVSQLHLGRLELTTERVDLLQLVEEVVNRFAMSETRHRIRVVTAESVVIQGDRDRLAHVLGDLIDNAVRYSPKGGDVDVTVRASVGEAIVSVRDQGIGIPREKQAHIFERFYRAHSGTPFDYGGMGVGLYVARQIIHRHGGRIWFESEEGRGSTFYFSLPINASR